MRNRLSILIVVALFASDASAGDTLWWDNGLVPNGFSGRALSPPSFPDIRVADDVIALRDDLPINGFHANVLEDAGWTDGGDILLEVREDTGNGPGTIVASHQGEFTKMDTGDDYFGRDDYDYWIEGIDIILDAGTYWMTIRNPNGGGAGTNYWMTSDGGADGPGSDTGWFSLDGGGSWSAEGDGWHHAFVVTAFPEPSTGLLLGIGGLVLLRRR